MKKTLLYIVTLFIYTFNVYAQQPILNDYSGDYILNGRVFSIPPKGSYEIQQMAERYDEELYLRLIDVHTGEYELTWRVASGSYQPMSVEMAKIFISEIGNISGEFNCKVGFPLVREKNSKGYGVSNCKCIVTGEFLNKKNKKLRIYYKLIESDEHLIMEGWRNGKRR
jgi:hypothetical protein